MRYWGLFEWPLVKAMCSEASIWIWYELSWNNSEQNCLNVQIMAPRIGPVINQSWATVLPLCSISTTAHFVFTLIILANVFHSRELLRGFVCWDQPAWSMASVLNYLIEPISEKKFDRRRLSLNWFQIYSCRRRCRRRHRRRRCRRRRHRCLLWRIWWDFFIMARTWLEWSAEKRGLCLRLTSRLFESPSRVFLFVKRSPSFQ